MAKARSLKEARTGKAKAAVVRRPMLATPMVTTKVPKVKVVVIQPLAEQEELSVPNVA